MLGREEQLLAALIVEAAVGYPAAVYRRIGHPVTWIGALIAAIETRVNCGGWHARRLAGCALLAVLVLVAGGAGWAIEGIGGAAVIVLLATTGLAQRSLYDHVASVLKPITAGDVANARGALAMIVGRDTAALDEAGIATGAIESLAESFCDGIVAPAFWFAVAGLPGLAVCKAINTADSMVGHRDARYAAFGWACARADDVVNWLPARLSGVMLCLVGGGGWRTMLRDARAHASPNGGWPEAAMAGALGVRLGGPVSYDGEPAARAWLGQGRSPEAGDLRRALAMYLRACLLLWGIVGVLAWLR